MSSRTGRSITAGTTFPRKLRTRKNIISCTCISVGDGTNAPARWIRGLHRSMHSMSPSSKSMCSSACSGLRIPGATAGSSTLAGARPIADLEKLVDEGRYQLAFAMQPVRVGTVLAIADENGVMPPKSTWFEPKLLSGLLIHTFD